MMHALRYAAEGFAVFPCRPGGKEPLGSLVPNGCLDATTDAKTIEGWWVKCPEANIGVVTGKKSGLAVVDLDGPEGIASGKKLGLQSSVVAVTGNGEQLFYADHIGLLGNSVKKLAAGVDTRGNGGYVVVPPSLHSNGKRYVWRTMPLSRTALTPLPKFFADPKPKVSGSTSTLRKPDGWMTEAIKALQNGHVHNNLISVLGAFKARNISENDTYTILQPHALVDGKPFGGLRDKITEIWKRYQQPPGHNMDKSETIDAFLEDIKEVDWTCKPFVAKKSIGFVVGLPATLKTWLCIDLAVECARGNGLWLGLFPTTTCKTLFIDQERWRGETQRRFKSVLAAKGISRSSLGDQLCVKSGTTIRLNIDSSYQALRTELLETRPELIIVDSFATFHTLPENDRTEIQKVLERIKELRNEIGCTFMFINHENKNAYPNGEPQGVPTMGTMVGSIGIGAVAEFCLTVRRVDDNTSLVHHTKSTQTSTAKSFYASVMDTSEGIVVRGLND